jgi:uncharacterized protein (DUF58 family)
MKEFTVGSLWPNKFFAKSKFRLNHFPKIKEDKTYIIPTRFGFYFGGSCLLLIYSSFASGNNLMYLYTFFLCSLGFTSLWLTHVNVTDVRVDSVTIEDVFADVPAYATVTLFNNSKKSRYFIKVYCQVTEPVVVEVIKPKSFTRVRVPLGYFSRGEHRLPRLTLNSTFPFLLLVSWKVYMFEKTFLVFPKREGVSNPPFIQALNENKEGRTIDQVRSADSEFAGHRKFENSDSSRHIDWKAFARTERLLVKDYQGYRPHQVNIQWKKTRDIKGLEKRLSQMALWIEIAESKGFHYSFEMGSQNFNSDRGRVHYLKCLKTLALTREEAI